MAGIFLGLIPPTGTFAPPAKCLFPKQDLPRQAFSFSPLRTAPFGLLPSPIFTPSSPPHSPASPWQAKESSQRFFGQSVGSSSSPPVSPPVSSTHRRLVISSRGWIELNNFDSTDSDAISAKTLPKSYSNARRTADIDTRAGRSPHRN